MSVCQVCFSRQERAAPHALMTREYYDILIKPLRFVAYKCGYALAVHGSLGFDIDLIACPWRDSCIDQDSLAERIRETAEAIIGIAESRRGEGKATEKPAGRKAYSFYLVPSDYPGPYIDLSVMPVGKHEPEKQTPPTE